MAASEYELQRQQRIAANEAKLRELGIIGRGSITATLAKGAPRTKPSKRPRRPTDDNVDAWSGGSGSSDSDSDEGSEEDDGGVGDELMNRARRARVGARSAPRKRPTAAGKRRRAQWSDDGSEREEEGGSDYSGSDHDSDNDPPDDDEPEEEEEEELFIVDKIVDMRFMGEYTEYKVRWRGYSSKDDTWENDTNLRRVCVELISDYHRVKKR